MFEERSDEFAVVGSKVARSGREQSSFAIAKSGDSFNATEQELA